MPHLVNYPLLAFAVSLPAIWLASAAGRWLKGAKASGGEQASHDLDVIVTSTLTLLGLIIAFTFSMAASRYEQRKHLEAVESNVIGTEIRRSDLLPAPDAATVRGLLIAYLDQRILFYTHVDAADRNRINRRTDQLETALWSAVRRPAAANPTPIAALAVAGMNDVIDSRAYTQAALWDRIPPVTWLLMMAIALYGNVLSGYASRASKLAGWLSLALPLVVSTSFLLIADIDTPKGGFIRLNPDNLSSLAASLRREQVGGGGISGP